MNATALVPYPVQPDRSAFSGTAAAASSNGFWSGEGSGFKDILDIINPLQQLPVVSTIYRETTGATISAGARLAGGALFGGPIGFVAALVNEIVHTQTGTDIGGNVMAAVTGKEVEPQLASADTVSTNHDYEGLCSHQRACYNAYVQSQRLS